MKIIPINNIKTLTPLLLIAMIFFSCKKNHGDRPQSGGDSTALNADFRDSVLDISRDDYLWYTLIPNDFNPQSYNSPASVMAGIMSYQPLDRFSKVLTEDEYQQQFVLGQNDQSFGISYKFDQQNLLRVAYSAKASAAYQAGVRRGWIINKVNNVEAKPANETDLLNILNNDQSASFTFKSLAGASKTLTLNKENVPADEVTYEDVISADNHNIGYLVYNSFFTTLNSNNMAEHPGLNVAFQHFKDKNITDLIIDLRYNGGGYTSIAEEMINAIAPQSADGQKMLEYQYNDKLNPSYGETVDINKNNAYNPPSLGNINKLVFIVSRETASASELVINSLKPYFPNLKLVGDTTDGKPVGYMIVPTPETHPQYEVLPVAFRAINSAGTSDYYNGFMPDKAVVDGVDKSWGDTDEACLKQALAYITSGSFISRNNNNRLTNPTPNVLLLQKINRALQPQKFNGMVMPPGRH